MLFHYGETWTKIDGMMDLCELYLETTVQVILQFLIYFFNPTRVASKSQLFSICKSGVMCFIGFSKVLLPAKLWNDQERSTIRKGMNILWGGFLISLIVGNHICYILLNPQVYNQERNGINQEYQELIIGGFSIIFLYSLVSCIFMYKNSFSKSRQAQLKCLLLSIYFLLFSLFISALYFQDMKNLPWKIGLGDGVTILNFIWHSIFLFYASFIVTRLHDIFNLEVIEPKQNCFLRHLPLTTIIFLILIDVFQGVWLQTLVAGSSRLVPATRDVVR